MVEFERARSALEELAGEFSEVLPLNEATTRLQMINRLLLDCLGWQPEDIHAEEPQSGDYLDYVLGQPERHAVVEAKRTDLHFEVPSGVIGERVVSLRTIHDYSSVNRDAVTQVLEYGLHGGIPVAVLSNGHQLIAFLASRQDGVPPMHGKALLFSSLAEMLSDFTTFWDYLSRDGVSSGNLRRAFAKRGTSAPPPERLSARLMNYPGFRSRSELETDVRILADLFLQDLVQEEEVSDDFLRECYCSSGALSQYALVSKEILKTRYAAISEPATESVHARKGGPARLTSDLLSAALTRRPLILLGDVGVGKTIFLKHFFRVDAAEILDTSLVVYIDFLTESSILVDIRSYLARRIRETLLEAGYDTLQETFIRAVYNKEINQSQKGLFGSLRESEPREYAKEERVMLAQHLEDGLEHLRRSLEHLRGTSGLNFVIVLDNIDHHESEFQERVFVVGQSLAETWPTAVFMSLRPDTFYNSRRVGSITAYQPRVFMVEPPRTDLVISKRLKFARRQLVETGRLESFPSGLTIDSESLVAYLDVLIEAFESNERLKELVDNLSSGNVRLALDFVSTFVGSGYVSTARILDIHRDGGQYTLPLHEFMRALMYGEYSHYDPRASPIPNVFDITSSDGREHFCLLELLASTQAYGESQQDGFAEARDIYEHMQGLGFSLEQIDEQLKRCLARKLLQASAGADGSAANSLRVTAAGGYMHKRMVSVFAYSDAVVVDTPIVDPAVRAQVVDARTIGDRLDRAEIFRKYLDAQWSLVGEPATFSWLAVSEGLRQDIESTRASAERNRQR